MKHRNLTNWLLLIGLSLSLFACGRNEIVGGGEGEEEKPGTEPVTGVLISPTKLTIDVGATVQLVASVTPSDARDKKVSWEAKNPEIASVSQDGKVKGIKAGRATVTVHTNEGDFYASCIVTVKDPDPPAVRVTGLILDKTSLVMEVGDEETIQAVVIPTDATNKEINWVSSKPEIASVLDGRITGEAVGTAVITATTVDGGKSQTCSVVVNEKTIPPRWEDTGADVVKNDYPYKVYNIPTTKADFPIVEITTDSGKPPASKDYYEGGTVRFRDPVQMYSTVTDIPAMSMQIRGRGNTTWEGQYGSKNPYRIKLSEHTKIFGMKGDKDWILLSDRLDNTMMRTAVAMRISRLVSMPWTPKFRMVRMTMNGEDKGLYYLIEQKEVDRANKVPVEVVYGNVDSGYLLELDNKSDSDAKFTSSTFRKVVKYKDPDPNDDDAAKKMTSAQKTYITNYFNSVESAMQSKNWEQVHNLIEMDTWIQNYFVHEVSMNKDGNMRLSTYFAKDVDTKLFMPFIWDFDRAFGQDSGQVSEFNLPEWYPNGWFVRIRGGYPGGESGETLRYGYRATYYQYLFEDPTFVARVKELWTLYKPRLDTVPTYIDLLSQYGAVVYSSSNKTNIATLRSKYIERIAWLDTNIKALQPQTYNQNTGKFQ